MVVPTIFLLSLRSILIAQALLSKSSFGNARSKSVSSLVEISCTLPQKKQRA